MVGNLQFNILTNIQVFSIRMFELKAISKSSSGYFFPIWRHNNEWGLQNILGQLKGRKFQFQTSRSTPSLLQKKGMQCSFLDIFPRVGVLDGSDFFNEVGSAFQNIFGLGFKTWSDFGWIRFFNQVGSGFQNIFGLVRSGFSFQNLVGSGLNIRVLNLIHLKLNFSCSIY